MVVSLVRPNETTERRALCTNVANLQLQEGGGNMNWAVFESWNVGGQANHWVSKRMSMAEADALAKKMKIERPERIVMVAKIVSEAVHETRMVAVPENEYPRSPCGTL